MVGWNASMGIFGGFLEDSWLIVFVVRDAVIISFMDTLTSFLAGVTIFSILGNLAYESGRDVSDVVDGGPGLAFISYPDAIAKFQAVPQLFAVLFFLMLATLGVGSAVSLTCAVVTVICDEFPGWRRGVVTVVICVVNFAVGVIYLTPVGFPFTFSTQLINQSKDSFECMAFFRLI